MATRSELSKKCDDMLPDILTMMCICRMEDTSNQILESSGMILDDEDKNAMEKPLLPEEVRAMMKLQTYLMIKLSELALSLES